ncbi:hypothetical protein [Arundinibacter roseus]|uniref:Uncharacterized protein n=1 Tax=Arundinibacter roseus TaxID=2070510 RepID=A0A4R4JTU1_9BACT|nr:hypothetical protein [Arundinibacter roseus]TDB56919.1 hypothetical protein EZE20_23870 [Arundinibacter roseus]
MNNYTSCEAGLGAKRSSYLWRKVLTKENKQPNILPFSLTYCLDDEGLYFYFSTFRYGIELNSYKKFYKFQISKYHIIENLITEANAKLLKTTDDYRQFLFLPNKEYFDYMNQHGIWDITYTSKKLIYPIASKEIVSLITDFVCFYPIYANYLRISCGSETILENQISKLKKWLIENLDNKLDLLN